MNMMNVKIFLKLNYLKTFEREMLSFMTRFIFWEFS